MTLWKAAYLWAGKVPALNYPTDAPGVVRALAERMANDVKRGNLQTVRTPTVDHPLMTWLGNYHDSSEYATVSRDALLAYAKLRDERPRFLFPN
jgi:hypothetical protein